MNTWKELIESALSEKGEVWQDVISCTLSEEELDQKFDGGYGLPEGLPFTLWTQDRVYFPVCYDGSEWCESVSRNPDDRPTFHKGGG